MINVGPNCACSMIDIAFHMAHLWDNKDEWHILGCAYLQESPFENNLWPLLMNLKDGDESNQGFFFHNGSALANKIFMVLGWQRRLI